jgi:hypothetical protein
VLDPALERLRKNFYHLWVVLKELRAYGEAEDLLRAWRRAPKPSQEWRKARFFETAIGVLSVALDLPREETAELLREYIVKRR